MGKPIGVAVVGVGSMGKNHARVFSEIPNVKLVGLSDINEETAREYAKKFHTEYFKDYRDLFDKIDAVCLAVPTSLHHKMAMDFLNHGVHVFVEKPITNMLFEAKEVSYNEALQTASKFFTPASSSKKQVKALNKQLSLATTFNQINETNKPAFYIINNGQNGFVIVSADD